ncbi:MAG: hypothetical protein KDK78_10355, partial [Chlamydiia bacterium]|nr:hypothetical protein [Chlamydiia bacterium]
LSQIVAGAFVLACGGKGIAKIHRAWKDCSFQFIQEQQRWQPGQRSPMDRAVIELKTGTGHASPLRQGAVGIGLLAVAGLGLVGAVTS